MLFLNLVTILFFKPIKTKIKNNKLQKINYILINLLIIVIIDKITYTVIYNSNKSNKEVI